MDRTRFSRSWPVLWVVGMLLPLAVPASAQRPDFLFRQPRVTLGVRGGWAVPRAGSDIFDFTTERLTVEPSDFGGFALEGELALRLSDRMDVTLGVGHARSSTASEFRDWVGTDDLPIEQTTLFSRTPVTLGLKAYLKDRGRAVSRFAWVPYDWAPWVGAGAGWMAYAFEQDGEFVDFETYDIFPRHFRSSGGAPTAHVAGGLDLSLTPHLLVTGEARYRWASADMSRDFVDFDPIDLSGFQLTMGLSARF